MKSLTSPTIKNHRNATPTINVTGPVTAAFVAATAIALAPVAVDKAMAMNTLIATNRTVAVVDQTVGVVQPITVVGVDEAVSVNEAVAFDGVVSTDKAGDNTVASVTARNETMNPFKVGDSLTRDTDATEHNGVSSGEKASSAEDLIVQRGKRNLFFKSSSCCWKML